jgi:hypothetical protein
VAYIGNTAASSINVSERLDLMFYQKGNEVVSYVDESDINTSLFAVRDFQKTRK